MDIQNEAAKISNDTFKKYELAIMGQNQLLGLEAVCSSKEEFNFFYTVQCLSNQVEVYELSKKYFIQELEKQKNRDQIDEEI